MNADDIQRQLDKLWERVTAPPAEASVVPPVPPDEYTFTDAPTITREVSLEAITLIKRQHREEMARSQQLLSLKERSIQELGERLAGAEREMASLRRRAQQDEQRIYQEVMGCSVELESAQKALKDQETRFTQQEAVLRGVAEQTRKQLAAEMARWRELERQWNEREQRYLLEVRELQARAQKSAEDAAQKEGAALRAADDLKEAKAAIESTLAELLKERTERESASKERDKALARVKEVEEHVTELQNLWEEERKQWQELWDRERSTWETQRQEFAAWEAKVRKEREDWHSQLQSIEGRETKYAEQMADTLRKCTDAGDKAANLMQAASDKAKELSGMTAKRPLIRWSRRKVIGAVLAAALLAAAHPAWKAANRLGFDLLESHILDVQSPTGMAYDGDMMMLSRWDGTLVSVDPAEPSQVLFRTGVKKAGAYHPVSMALWGDSLYSLDSAQGRILMHAAATPGKIAVQWRSPGPAPMTLAHDGRNLWSYDAASHAVYRHLGEGPQAQSEPFSVGIDILPGAMAWHKDDLWVYDSKGKQILLLRIEGKSLKLVRAEPFKTPIQAMTLTFRAREGKQRFELWALSVPPEGAGEPTLRKYRIKQGLFR